MYMRPLARTRATEAYIPQSRLGNGYEGRLGSVPESRCLFFNLPIREILPIRQNSLEREQKRYRSDSSNPGPPHKRCQSNHGQPIGSQDGMLSILIADHDIVYLKRFGRLPWEGRSWPNPPSRYPPGRSLFQTEDTKGIPHFRRHLHIQPEKGELTKRGPPLAAIMIMVQGRGDIGRWPIISGRFCRYRCRSARSMGGRFSILIAANDIVLANPFTRTARRRRRGRGRPNLIHPQP